MENEKRKPINPRLDHVIKGIFFCMFAIIIGLNVGKVGRTLAFLPVYLFGISYYFFCVLFFVGGLYRIIKGKPFRTKKFHIILAVILLFFGVFMIASVNTVNINYPGGGRLYLSHFNERLGSYYKETYINMFDLSNYYQGGVLGILLAYAIKSSVITIFAGAVSIFFALLLIFFAPIRKAIKKHKEESKANKAKKKEIIKLVKEDNKPVENNPIGKEEIKVNVPGFESDKKPFVNENSGFDRPTISLDEAYGVNYLDKNEYNEFSPLVFFDESKQSIPVATSFEEKVVEEVKPQVTPSEETKEELLVEEEEEIEENFVEVRPNVNPAPTPSYNNENRIAVEVEEPASNPNNFSNFNQVEQKEEPVREKIVWIPPSPELLATYQTDDAREQNEQLANERMELINRIFTNFKIGARCIGFTIGPSVTRYNIECDPNVSVKTVERLVDDISMRLGDNSTRFTSIIPGETFSGLEVPNAMITTVSFKDVITSLPDVKKHPSAVGFGKDISGKVVYADYVEFPHLLVAGTTGSGKSIYIHSIICTLIMRMSPEELRIVLVDPKKVEMTRYRDMPHLLCPIITEADKAKVMLTKLVEEMNNRYEIFGNNDEVSNIKEYNAWAKEHDIAPLPYIVVVLDEYADLVDTCKEISQPVVSIAQKARAAGIHLLISTQRPSTNVITGVIKGNLPTHVALTTANYTDSITIIGEAGAETLLGKGDMLVQSPLISRTGVTRLQGCFVQNKEINHIVGYLKEHYKTYYDEKFLDLVDHSKESAQQLIASGEIEREADDAEENKYQSIKEWVLTQEFVSMSKIQRECSVGFNRAGRFFNRLQKEGIVATQIDGTSKGCRVLVHEKFYDDDQVVTSSELID